jgi:hypothetical protein
LCNPIKAEVLLDGGQDHVALSGVEACIAEEISSLYHVRKDLRCIHRPIGLIICRP